MDDQSFPSKRIWNNIINAAIHETYESQLKERLSAENDSALFREIHNSISPHQAWIVAKDFPELLPAAKYVVNLCALVEPLSSEMLCEKCGRFFTEVVTHILTVCTYTLETREDFWRDVISLEPIEFSVFLDSLTPETLCLTLLSCSTDFDLDDENSLAFSKICLDFIYHSCRQFHK